MIFNKQGVPLKEAFLNAALAREEHRRQRLAGRNTLELDYSGEYIYRILRDKIGNAYRVFRAVLKDTSSGPYNKAQENARRAGK